MTDPAWFPLEHLLSFDVQMPTMITAISMKKNPLSSESLVHRLEKFSLYYLFLNKVLFIKYILEATDKAHCVKISGLVLP